MNSREKPSNPIRPRHQFLMFGAPAIEDAEIQEVVASLKRGWLGTGPKVAQFEHAFKCYKGSREAIAVNSCTAALHLAMLALGLGQGDEVIVTPMTFCATINTILHTGATPVLADINLSSMNIDPVEVEARITSRTKAIVPVHFAGRPCNMDALLDICQRYNLKMIEDCAHSIETEYKGQKTGTFGNFGCFSFYTTKNLVTGEGGMILTEQVDDATRLKILSLHGMSKDAWKRFGEQGYQHYDVLECGYKYNMTDLQAAIGIHQLQRLEKNWKRRHDIWHQYQTAFADCPIGLPAEPEPETRHAYHLYTILIDEHKTGIRRDDFLEGMIAENIGVGVHYQSVAEHTYYQQTLGWQPEDCPNAMAIGRKTVSIPLSVKLTNNDVDDVIRAVKKVLSV